MAVGLLEITKREVLGIARNLLDRVGTAHSIEFHPGHFLLCRVLVD